MPSCWFSLQFACINKQLFCFKFPKHNHGLDCPGAACSSSQNCCQSCFGRNKQLSSKWYMAVNSSGYKRNLTHWNQHWWKQMRCWRSHCWHGYWFFPDCCDHTGSLCCTCADPTAREVCQGKMRQADHFIYSTWASSQHAPASHFISKWTLVLLLILVSQVVSINFKKLCACAAVEISICQYPFAFVDPRVQNMRSSLWLVPTPAWPARCGRRTDVWMMFVWMMFVLFSPGLPRVLWMAGRGSLIPWREHSPALSEGLRHFKRCMCHFCESEASNVPEDRGFPHWVLDDPQVGRGDSCRCVWLSLWFLCERPSKKIPMTKFLQSAPWCQLRKGPRTTTSQPQHMNKVICMCTCLCSKESLCSDISNVVCVNWRPRSATQFPCLSPPLRIWLWPPDEDVQFEGKETLLKSWRRWAPSASGATF